MCFSVHRSDIDANLTAYRRETEKELAERNWFPELFLFNMIPKYISLIFSLNLCIAGLKRIKLTGMYELMNSCLVAFPVCQGGYKISIRAL